MSLDRLKQIGIDLDDIPEDAIITSAVVILQVHHMDEDHARTYLDHSDGLGPTLQLGMVRMALLRCEQKSLLGWEDEE